MLEYFVLKRRTSNIFKLQKNQTLTIAADIGKQGEGCTFEMWKMRLDS